MKSFLQIITGSIVGAFCGAIFGAALLGIPAYMDTRSGWLGTSRSWAGVAAYIGAICGFVPGIIIGFIVGTTRCNKVSGALIGAGVGFVIAAYLLSATTYLDREIRAFGVSAIPLGALVGLIATLITRMPRAWQSS